MKCSQAPFPAAAAVAAIVSVAAVLLALNPGCSRGSSSNRCIHPVLDDSSGLSHNVSLISRNVECVDGSESGPESYQRFCTVLDSTAASIKRQLGNEAALPAAADAICGVVYREWRIGFDPADSLVETLLPHIVYKNRKGSCLGVALVILMLAEKTGCPLYGVLLPGHFFCRYDNGDVRFNIEPNRSGFRHPDSYYKERYSVGSRPWYDMRNLTGRETIGVLCYNAGTIMLARGHAEEARDYFREAAVRLPDFNEAWGNWALSYDRLGFPDTAEALFAEAFEVCPSMENLAANYGTVAMRSGHYKTAVEVFRKGLRFFPEDTFLLKGLEEAQKQAVAAIER